MSNTLVPVEEEKVVSVEEKKQALQQSLYYLLNRNPFLAVMLQELLVKYTKAIPTAGITFNKKSKAFEVFLNEDFFCTRLDLNERIAVLSHEILHFLHQHLFRLPFLSKDKTAEQKMVYNIAGDMSINQYITGLPKGGIDVRDWKLNNGSPFPVLQTMEQYYELIIQNQKHNKDKMPQSGKGKGKGEVPGEGGYEYGEGGEPLDMHGWDELTPEEKEDFLSESKKLIERTMEKTSFDYDDLPGYVKDTLRAVEVELAEINYKRILRDAIKRNASATDRESTWNRPNKRFGVYCQGTRLGKLPKLNMYVDTSGSISTIELNEFLKVMDGFLKVGVRTCNLALWHTEMYYKERYKYGQQFNESQVQSGGTELTDVITDINKVEPDLTIILTDGYYGHPSVEPKGEVVWIISKGGDLNHAFQKIGKTISLDKIK